MSDAHDEHETFIKTPKQLIWIVVASFVIPVLLIVMLAQYVTGDNKVGAGSSALTDAAIDARLKPVSVDVIPNDPAVAALNQAAGASAAPAGAPAKLTADSGKKLYETACMACHGSGVAGAPKFADKAAWAPRIKQGAETLYTHAIQGFKGMPPKGGSSASDAEIKLAVDYMAAASK